MTSEKITLKDVYKTLWRCRDFEISTLWQRSVMLGAFLSLTYVGYGTLLLKIVDGIKCHWAIFNLLAVGVSIFGMVFSSLWIMMMKGSKAWYEQYEGTLIYFQHHCLDAVESDAQSFVGLNASSNNAVKNMTMRDFDKSLLSVNAGPYSVSKLATVIGIVSFCGWILIAIGHTAAILLEKDICRDILYSRDLSFSLSIVFIALILSVIIPVIAKSVNSRFFMK